MLSKISKSLKRWRFKQSIKKLHATPFCLISNNCLGRRLYKILHRPYNTPFIGLFMMPDCFAKLVAEFEIVIMMELKFTQHSKYPDLHAAREQDTERESPYPIGLLGDIEIHFLHYENEQEAQEKWQRRCARIDMKHLYFIMVANGPYDDSTLSQLLGTTPENKVVFHRDPNLDRPSCVYIPSKAKDMGNLYSQYQRFVGRFSFLDWIRQKGTLRQTDA